MDEWNVDRIICKYTPKSSGNQCPTSAIEEQKTGSVSFEDIKESYELMANIVTEQGEEYLPIFSRLHDELESHIAKRNLLSIAFNVSNKKDE